MFPATHYVAGDERHAQGRRAASRPSCRSGWRGSRREGKLLEAQRLRMRTQYDLEMMQEVGYCNGIENYSMPIDGRHHGEPPYTLLDYFPDDFLLVIDESHVAVPQLHGQYEGDRSRKDTLVEHGFRLPSRRRQPAAAVRGGHGAASTRSCSCRPRPARYELAACRRRSSSRSCARPGLVDPEVIVKPTKGQIDDLIEQINERVAAGDRVLVTTLTKKMAEDLTDYLLELGVRVRYLHSRSTPSSASRSCATCASASSTCWSASTCCGRASTCPRCRSSPSSTPTRRASSAARRRSSRRSGRAARNVDGQVIMYADTVTDSMQRAISETNRRRQAAGGLQRRARHRPADDPQGRHRHPRPPPPGTTATPVPGRDRRSRTRDQRAAPSWPSCPHDELERLIHTLEEEMHEASADLRFEYAARLRDEIKDLKRELREVV